jgi:hypothetical protein
MDRVNARAKGEIACLARLAWAASTARPRVLVTPHLRLAAQICGDILVMYGGRVRRKAYGLVTTRPFTLNSRQPACIVTTAV